MEKNRPVLMIMYHFPCFDGAYAAINAYMYYMNFSRTYYHLKIIPIKNIHPKIPHFESIKPKKIIILDLNLSQDEIDYFKNKTNNNISLIIFDHHKTGIHLFNQHKNELLANNNKIKIIFSENNTKSACGLSFDYYKKKALLRFNKKDVGVYYSKYVESINKYIEDTDIESNILYKSPEFKSGLNNLYKPISQHTDFSKWNQINYKMSTLLNLNINQCIKEGNISLSKYKKEAENELLHSRIIILAPNDKVKFYACVPSQKRYRNHAAPILARLSQDKGYVPVGAFIYLFEDVNNVYKISLRNAKNNIIDLSAFAEEFGGGGHVNAAAFTMSWEQIEKCIVEDNIKLTKDIIDKFK